MKDSLQKVIATNNQAVRFLHKGKYRLAAKGFSEALKITKAAALTCLQQGDGVNEENAKGFNIDEHATMWDVRPGEPIKIFENDNTQDFYLLNRPILIFSASSSGKSQTGDKAIHSREIETFVASIILNLALTHHSQGIHTRKQANLIKARSLYNIAEEMLASSVVQGDGWEVSPSSLFVFLVAVNNSTRFFIEEGHFETSRRRLEGITPLLAVPGLNKDLVQGIAHNSILLEITDKHIRAAAAA